MHRLRGEFIAELRNTAKFPLGDDGTCDAARLVMTARALRALSTLILGAVVVTCTTNDGAPSDASIDAPGLDASSDAPVPHPAISLADYPRMDGSTSTIPLDMLIACEVLGVPYRWQAGVGSDGESSIVPDPHDAAQKVVADEIWRRIVHSKTHEAFLNLIDRKADLLLVASPPSTSERAYAAGVGVDLQWEEIALDGVVILLNGKNTTPKLSVAQIQDIYAGKIKDWSEVGGAPGEIHPYTRPVESGSYQLMSAIVMEGKPMADWPPDRISVPMSGLVDAVAADPLAIGYSVYYYVTYQVPRNLATRIVPVSRTATSEPILPRGRTLGDRSFPFVAPVLIVHRSGLDPTTPAGKLHDWLLTRDGQTVVGRSGYVPVSL